MSEVSVLDPDGGAAHDLFAPRARTGWRSAWPLVGSAVLHVVVVAWLVLPRLPALVPAEAPVNVDIVTPSQLASLERTMSSATPSASAPASSSAAVSSSEAASSQPASSAAAASSTEPASAAAASEPPPTSQQPPPAGKPAARSGHLVVPVGNADSSSEEQSSEASSAASDTEASASAASDAPPQMLTANGGSEGGASSLAPTPPVGGGTMQPAKHFYLADMLRAPGLSRVRDTLKTLPPERRLAETCEIEALGQAGHAGYTADAIIANAFAPPQSSGQSYSASGGALRASGSWYRVAYDCTLNADMSKVTAFSFHIGDDVTDVITTRLKTPKG